MTKIIDIKDLSKPGAVRSFIGDLTYINYRHNRMISPGTTPEQWEKVYGPNTKAMEKRFEQELYDAITEVDLRAAFDEPEGKS